MRNRLVRFAFAVLLVLPGLAHVVTVSAQDSLDDTSYTDEVFGFVVTWPEDAYDASVLEFDDGTPYGVNLDFPSGFAMVAAFGYDTTQECLDANAESLEEFRWCREL